MKDFAMTILKRIFVYLFFYFRKTYTFPPYFGRYFTFPPVFTKCIHFPPPMFVPFTYFWLHLWCLLPPILTYWTPLYACACACFIELNQLCQSLLLPI